jgi:hypothetical protein
LCDSPLDDGVGFRVGVELHSRPNGTREGHQSGGVRLADGLVLGLGNLIGLRSREGFHNEFRSGGVPENSSPPPWSRSRRFSESA